MDKIKQLRVAKGLPKETVAEQIGMSRPTYNQVETGEKDLTIKELNRLAFLLGVPVGELLYDIGQVPTDDFGYSKYKQMILNSLRFGADSDGKITKTKLAKLVYLSDFAWFYKYLKPMSGLQYRRIPQGPVPDTYFRAIEELFADEAINIECKGNAFMIELTETPSSSELIKDELSLIKEVGRAWKNKKTDEIVKFTHTQLPWKLCGPGEIIPYELITQEDPGNVY